MSTKTTTSEQIRAVLRAHKDELQRRFNVQDIGIFGSYARGDVSEASDVDILVTFKEPIGLDFVELAHYLEDVLGKPVDLVSKNALRPNMLRYVLDDVRYV